ncbi:MAG: DegT/DnrJ/EryC1/StrS family aminotransferase [Vicinamibacteria bacterium]
MTSAPSHEPGSPRPLPLVNLVALHARIKNEIAEVSARVVETGAFINGPDCAAFEKEFALFCGVKGAVGCANGTDSLELILRAMNIGPGDEVITAANSFVATAEAIALTGAVPVFVDCVADTSLINPALIEAAITKRTRAIIPVDLYGHPGPMDEIVAIASRHGLRVIEDAAQSHGASLNGRRAGSFGDAASFSFYPGKNLGAIGDGGMVVSNDLELLARVRQIASHGAGKDRYRSEVLGRNSRLDTIQAGVLRIKLRLLDGWNQTRRDRARLYCELLKDFDRVVLPVETEGAVSSWHLFVIQTERRADLMASLAAEKIATGIHYPVPIHMQPAFATEGQKPGRFPVAEHLADRIVSLPLCPEVSEDDVRRVVAVIRRTLA